MRAGRIVLFGATGYTGRLTATALAAGDVPLSFVGRDQEKLDRLAADLGVGETARADADDPVRLAGLLQSGDVLVSTVGPFALHGAAAVEAAIAAEVPYLDSTGEPGFIRRVFEDWGPRAANRCALVCAFGYDYLPGNLAAAMALEEAGDDAVHVDVGYFLGGGPPSASTGTVASAMGMLAEPGFAWRGRIVDEPPGRRVRTFSFRGRDREGLSIGGSEHFALPRLAPRLQRVDVYLGWFGPFTRIAQGALLAGSAVAGAVPGIEGLAGSASRWLSRRTGSGPDETARGRTRSDVVAVARDVHGSPLATVHLSGGDPYELTAAALAWGATAAAGGGLKGTGALGPVEAFGLSELRAGMAAAGLDRVADAGADPQG